MWFVFYENIMCAVNNTRRVLLIILCTIKVIVQCSPGTSTTHDTRIDCETSRIARATYLSKIPNDTKLHVCRSKARSPRLSVGFYWSIWTSRGYLSTSTVSGTWQSSIRWRLPRSTDERFRRPDPRRKQFHNCASFQRFIVSINIYTFLEKKKNFFCRWH